MENGTEPGMEQGFSERLKRYRKEKNLTQQQLADALGVSNKSVSRWESGGGYPDLPLLVPLAKTLGVTADDLLDEEKPVRALTRADWQGLLSFAFALGGGLLFYLLATFAPLAVCYAVYLACLCYGAYLQRYYARHSRWFWLGAAGMNLAVNWSAALELVLLVGMFVRLGPAVLLLQTQKELGLESFWLALVLFGGAGTGGHRPHPAPAAPSVFRRFAGGAYPWLAYAPGPGAAAAAGLCAAGRVLGHVPVAEAAAGALAAAGLAVRRAAGGAGCGLCPGAEATGAAADGGPSHPGHERRSLVAEAAEWNYLGEEPFHRQAV